MTQLSQDDHNAQTIGMVPFAWNIDKFIVLVGYWNLGHGWSGDMG